MREVFFQLAWHEHGGSGLMVTLGELEDMRAEELIWYLRRVQEKRQQEAAAMKAASPRTRRSK